MHTNSSTRPARHRAPRRPVILPRGPYVAVTPLADGTRIVSAHFGGEHRA